MARGITIGDVNNKLQQVNNNVVIPVSSGTDKPEVVTVGVLKEYINEDIDTALEGKQDVINDLDTIRSGAALGATAVQEESDPTVPSWAKQSSKPSYSYSEITGKPTLSTVATSGSYNDLTNKPDIPSEQIQSDWNQSNDSSKDYIKNKPTIPTVPTNVSAFTNDAGYLTEHQDISGKANSDDLATVAFSGDYEDLTNTPTIPDVPNWAMSSTKPSYAVSEIDGAQEELVSSTNIKTINNESILGSGNITIQGGGGDVNVIESITFNGSAVPVDVSKNAAITYTETEPDFNGSAAAGITSSDITAWNGKQNALVFNTAYDASSNKVATMSDIPDISTKQDVIDSSHKLSADLITDGTTNKVINVKPDWNAASGNDAEILNKPTIPTVPSNVSAFTNDAGYTTNTGTITSVKMNGSTVSLSGEADLGTVITSHQDISGKADKSEMSVSASGDQTTITLKSGTSATVINQHQSLSGYVQTSNTAGLLKNDGTVDTTSYGTYSKPSGGIPASDIASGVIPDVSSKEDTSNKVTSLSSASTDTQYPSAKCVYDLVGDIETLLAAI